MTYSPASTPFQALPKTTLRLRRSAKPAWRSRRPATFKVEIFKGQVFFPQKNTKMPEEFKRLKFLHWCFGIGLTC